MNYDCWYLDCVTFEPPCIIYFFVGFSGSNRRNDCCFIAQWSSCIYLFFSPSAALGNNHVCLYMYIHVHLHSTSHLVHENASPSLYNIREWVLFVLLTGSVRRSTVQSTSWLVRVNSTIRRMSITSTRWSVTSTICWAEEHGCTFEDYYKQCEENICVW